MENRIRIGKISSRPASISRIRITLENILYAPKLLIGPTASNPGPILLKHASTAEKFVVTEKPSSETKIKLKIMIKK